MPKKKFEQKQLEEFLEVAKEIALQAGNTVREFHGRTHTTIRVKKDQTPVTDADEASDKIIRTQLREKFPGHGIVTEENFKGSKGKLSTEFTWYVDPLDGTNSYIRRSDEFSIVLGLVHRHAPIAGVVYVPMQGKLYAAAQDNGAVLIHKGKTTTLQTTYKTLEKAILLSSIKGSSDIARLESLKRELGAQDVMASGSFGIKVCLIAEGKGDLYVNNLRSTGEWDSCGPSIILTEAGGTVTDLEGRAIIYNKNNVPYLPNGAVCSNGKCHARAIDRIKGHLVPE